MNIGEPVRREVWEPLEEPVPVPTPEPDEAPVEVSPVEVPA